MRLNNGDSYRWDLWRYAQPPTTINVIEPAKDKDVPKGANKVPFGFARALPRVEHEPLLWEGD